MGQKKENKARSEDKTRRRKKGPSCAKWLSTKAGKKTQGVSRRHGEERRGHVESGGQFKTKSEGQSKAKSEGQQKIEDHERRKLLSPWGVSVHGLSNINGQLQPKKTLCKKDSKFF